MTHHVPQVAQSLKRWGEYLEQYSLPAWNELPDFGLYMEQVMVLMTQYLDYLPPEIKDEGTITAATINNYVRKKVMPEPVKKKYYRPHLAYLIMICTLKQSMSIATIQRLLPVDLQKEQLEEAYTSFVGLHHRSCSYFIDQVKIAAADVLAAAEGGEDNASPERVRELIMQSAVSGGLARLLAEKLLLLDEEAPAEEAGE